MPDLDCLLPSTNDLIGQHQLHLERRLSEVLFKTESAVFIECGDGVEHIQAVIKSIVGSIAFVQFCDEKSLEEVKLDQLVIGVSPYPSASVYSFDNLFSLRNLDSNQLMKPISSYIQSGNFFELIDYENPRVVRTVKIVDNRNGFVRAVDARGQQHSVLISSERCRRIGWALLGRNEEQFQLEPFLGTTIKNIVPWFMFDRCQLREHNIEINQVFEVIDPSTRYRIVPGVVTEIFNRYFFRVSLVYSQHDQNLPSLICHRGSPDLLPANFCQRSGLRLAVPEGIDETNFNIYKIRGKHATDYLLDIPKNVERFDTGRQVEIYDDINKQMIPGTILRQHRHLLIVRLENQRQFSPPRLYAYYDERLFNVGAAERYGLKLAKTPELIDRSCWTFRLGYQIVTRPSEHDPLNGKRFMSRVFSDASQFLPEMFVNFDCYKGPFINDETARFIDTNIASCHFQPVMKYIIHSVLEDVIKFEYQRFAAAQPQTQAPTYTIKLTNPKNDKRSRTLQVEVCESAEQFPGWLRQFLLRLEICPNFISPIKRLPNEPCPQGCHVIGDLFPFMLPGMHIHNPANISKLEEQRAKRQNLGAGTTMSSASGSRVQHPRNELGTIADHNDLDEPLSIRRARRQITATKRHEIIIEEPPAWRRRQMASQPFTNLPAHSSSTFVNPLQQQRRKRTVSNDYGSSSSFDPSSVFAKQARFGTQNVPPRTARTQKDHLMEMTQKVDETFRENLSSWSTTSRPIAQIPLPGKPGGVNGHRQHEAIKAAAVRKGNGPRMLFPTGTGIPPQLRPISSESPVMASIGQHEEFPPRLQPANQQHKEESSDSTDEDIDMYEENMDETELKGMDRLSAAPSFEPESTGTRPEIQEYVRRTREKQNNPASDPNIPSSSRSSLLRPSTVRLEKPGEYDTEIIPPKKPVKIPPEIEELLEKYNLKVTDNPSNWQKKELVTFMRRQNFNEAADFLETEEFDGQSFFLMSEEVIKEIGLKRGPELNLKRMLKELKDISAYTQSASLSR